MHGQPFLRKRGRWLRLVGSKRPEKKCEESYWLVSEVDEEDEGLIGAGDCAKERRLCANGGALLF